MNKVQLFLGLALAVNSLILAAEIDTELYENDCIIVKNTEQSQVNAELLAAAKKYDWKDVLSALRRGAYVNCTDSDGNTPLILVARYPECEEMLNARVKIIAMLLDEAADTDMKNIDGESARSIIYSNGSFEDPRVFEAPRKWFNCCILI